VREHLKMLHLRALQSAHPHEYRVRLVRDELRNAHTAKQEAERYVQALEEQLAGRNDRIQELTHDKARLRAAWEAEIHELSGELNLARERAAQYEQRCQQLEAILDRLDSASPSEKSIGAYFPVHDLTAVSSQLATFLDEGLEDEMLVLAERAAAHVPVSDLRELVPLLTTMHAVGAVDQANRLARRAADQGRLDREDLKRLEAKALVTLLMTLHAVNADDLARRLASDAISCAWRGDKSDVENMLLILRTVGAVHEARKLAAESWQLQVSWFSHGSKSTQSTSNGPLSLTGRRK
jgi:hypothetical protein